jgi:hypothetical protein
MNFWAAILTFVLNTTCIAAVSLAFLTYWVQ